MKRRHFISTVPLAGLVPHAIAGGLKQPAAENTDRQFWLDTLLRIVTPVTELLAEGRLKKELPLKCQAGQEDERKKYTHLEAIARCLCGLSPWLALDPGNLPEDKLRYTYIQKVQQGISIAVDPASDDYLNFENGTQPLVDAAFLAHSMLRAPRILYHDLPGKDKNNLIEQLKKNRAIKPYENNWLLFSAMIEAAIYQFTGEMNPQPVIYAIEQHEKWYKGDGIYGDGPDFHWDYYNSFVI